MGDQVQIPDISQVLCDPSRGARLLAGQLLVQALPLKAIYYKPIFDWKGGDLAVLYLDLPNELHGLLHVPHASRA